MPRLTQKKRTAHLLGHVRTRKSPRKKLIHRDPLQNELFAGNPTVTQSDVEEYMLRVRHWPPDDRRRRTLAPYMNIPGKIAALKQSGTLTETFNAHRRQNDPIF